MIRLSYCTINRRQITKLSLEDPNRSTSEEIHFPPSDRVSLIECVIKNTQKGNGGREGGEESLVDQLRATPLKSHLSVAVFNWQMRQMRDETTLCERRECNIPYSSSVYIIIGNI